MLFYSTASLTRGPALIGAGLFVIAAAQFWPAVPVIATMVLIGWGSVLTLHSSPRTSRQDTLSLVNLVLYTTLVGLAIVAQSHRALQHVPEQADLAMLVDHSAAIMLLFALAAHVFRRICQPET